MERRFHQAAELSASVTYAPDSVVSKTILKNDGGTLTLFAFDRGQGLSEHTAPFDAAVLVLEGAAVVTVGGEDQRLTVGGFIVMPANVPHALRAEERFKMLLFMLR